MLEAVFQKEMVLGHIEKHQKNEFSTTYPSIGKGKNELHSFLESHVRIVPIVSKHLLGDD
jgi:hypothetical protein